MRAIWGEPADWGLNQLRHDKGPYFAGGVLTSGLFIVICPDNHARVSQYISICMYPPTPPCGSMVTSTGLNV